MNLDYFFIALSNLENRKLRTALTILGIIIGVSSIVALIAISQGLENAIIDQFEEIGTDKIFIAPKQFAGSGNIQQGLTTNDVDALKRLPYFDFVTEYVIVSGTVGSGNQKEFFSGITGYPTDNAKERMEQIGLTLYKGRYFKESDSHVAIIGNDVAYELYDKDILLNNNLKIRDNKYKVIGILNPIGNSDDDTRIYLPVDEVRSIFERKNEVAFIELNVKDGLELTSIAKKVEDALEDSRNNEEFEVMTPDETLATFKSILGIVQIVLGGIAAISIVVGAIGIMNSLYTSVLERTKEIGIMKAIGAKRRNILSIFLLEAGIIGLLGGVIGVIFGIVIAKVVGIVASNAGFSLLLIKIDPLLVLGGLLFALGVGLLSGFFPALQAARLLPITALRSK